MENLAQDVSSMPSEAEEVVNGVIEVKLETDNTSVKSDNERVTDEKNRCKLCLANI